MKNSLGNKIRFFRKRAGLSQFNLELAIGASAGMISRIENGMVNPKRETLKKISKELSLNEYEKNYLYGAFAEPVTKYEAERILKDIQQHMNKDEVMGYIVDERSRVWFASDNFLKFMKLSTEKIERYYGETIHKFLLSKDLRISNFISSQRRFEIYKNLFYRTRREMEFMLGDPWYDQVLEYIDGDAIARKAWEQVLSEPPKALHTIDNRLVLFKMGPIEISKHFSVEPVLDNERFRVVEWN